MQRDGRNKQGADSRIQRALRGERHELSFREVSVKTPEGEVAEILRRIQQAERDLLTGK